jgi:hypothetical protein
VWCVALRIAVLPAAAQPYDTSRFPRDADSCDGDRRADLDDELEAVEWHQHLDHRGEAKLGPRISPRGRGKPGRVNCLNLR